MEHRLDADALTFGAEHEFADNPVHVPLPAGWGRDPEHTIVNSNGVAADPSGKSYGYGGEINTPPTNTAAGQVDHFQWIKSTFPTSTINYRTNLHIHIRVPGLKYNLMDLKRMQLYIHQYMRYAIELLVPLPKPTETDFPDSKELKGALRRWRRRCVSHRTLLSDERLKRQMEAQTLEQFFDLEPPQSKDGKPLFHAQPRLMVNLRQLKQTDTIEFRHFPQTLDDEELFNCCGWCEMFTRAALRDAKPTKILKWAEKQKFPQFPKYIHEMEKRFRATVHDGSLTPAQIRSNMSLILAEAEQFPVEGDLEQHWRRVREYYRSAGKELQLAYPA